MTHWLGLWDYLDRNFWAYCQWFGRDLTAEQIGWQPIPQIASIGWNLRHLAEMLDHYLTHVFEVQDDTFSTTPLVTMVDDSQDDGRFKNLAAIMDYHHQVRPAYRKYLLSLKLVDLDRRLSQRPNARTVGWAIGHIAEHESYHLGKCTLLRNWLVHRKQSS